MPFRVSEIICWFILVVVIVVIIVETIAISSFATFFLISFRYEVMFCVAFSHLLFIFVLLLCVLFFFCIKFVLSLSLSILFHIVIMCLRCIFETIWVFYSTRNYFESVTILIVYRWEFFFNLMCADYYFIVPLIILKRF